MRYLQYEKHSGRIVGELVEADPLPELYAGASDFYGYLPVEDAMTYDPRACVVKDGELARAWETGGERRERERLKKQQRESGLSLLSLLSREFLVALLLEDGEEMARLREEAAPLKKFYRR
jgi:hypothetical protein